jgi:hypothetical protein
LLAISLQSQAVFLAFRFTLFIFRPPKWVNKMANNGERSLAVADYFGPVPNANPPWADGSHRTIIPHFGSANRDG